MKAWHFVGKTLRNWDPIPKDGEWLTYTGPLKMCESGLHASIAPFDALQYAPGDTLCLVEVGGKVIKGDDKLVCSRRKIIARMDFEEPLRYFARMQALSVVHFWDAPDVVLDYLMTGDGSIMAAAGAAAGAAARDTAWAAAGAAAGAAARAAARDAAAKVTARDAAEAAAWGAGAVARATARKDFNALVRECFEGCL